MWVRILDYFFYLCQTFTELKPVAWLGGKSGECSASTTQISATDKSEPWSELLKTYQCPKQDTDVTQLLPQPAWVQGPGGDPIPHRAKSTLHHSESGDAVRCCFFVLATHGTLILPSFGLVQPLITPSNRKWRIFSILELSSLSLEYGIAIKSSGP